MNFKFLGISKKPKMDFNRTKILLVKWEKSIQIGFAGEKRLIVEAVMVINYEKGTRSSILSIPNQVPSW
jgi:hypothetical protein